MSTPTNRIVRSTAPKEILSDIQVGRGLTTSISYNQGDLLIFDVATQTVKKPAAESEGSTFLGIATNTVASGVAVGPYSGLATTAQAQSLIAGPQYGVEASMILKNGDALVFGASVYLDPASGPEFVQASGTKAIGIYEGPSITGNGSLPVRCLLGARFPNDTLKF